MIAKLQELLLSGIVVMSMSVFPYLVVNSPLKEMFLKGELEAAIIDNDK